MSVLQQIWLYKIIGGTLPMCQNTTMQVYGAWIKRYSVLCSKTYNTLHTCHNFPACSRQAARGLHFCETSLLLLIKHFRNVFDFACSTTSTYLYPVFKISARPQTLTGKIWVGPASFPSLLYINFGKIALWSGKFEILFWRLCIKARTVEISHTVN